MNYKKIFRLFLCALIILQSQSFVIYGQAPLPDAVPEMTEEDFLAWQKSMDAEIDNFVKSLPEDQQKQFNQDVADLTVMMENMTEDELAEFIQGIFAQEEPVAPEQPKAPVTQEVVPTPEPAVVEVALEGTDKALKIIENIINRTERFLRTTQRIPELPGAIDRWVEKDKIKEWQRDLTWETLKSRIQSLDQKVTQLKERDPVTKTYRYINSLIKKEATYNNIIKLSDNLTAAEPKVEAPSGGLGPVSKESRTAIKQVLSSFAEAIYTLELEQALDAIIAEYEPRAKQLKEEEEAAHKRSIEESKKGLKESPRKVIGGKKTDGGYYSPGAGGDYDYPYAPGGGYYPGGGGYDYDSPYAPDRYRSEESKTAEQTPAAAGGAGQKTDEKDKDKEPGAPKRSDDYKKAVEFIENASTIIEDLLIDNSADTMKKYIQLIANQPYQANHPDAKTIKGAASALRRVKRKMDSMANKQEQAEIRKRMEKEKEFTNIENEMKSRRVDENSNEILQELKLLSDAISSLKYEGFTASPLIKRAEPRSEPAAKAAAAEQGAAPAAPAPAQHAEEEKKAAAAVVPVVAPAPAAEVGAQ